MLSKGEATVKIDAYPPHDLLKCDSPFSVINGVCNGWEGGLSPLSEVHKVKFVRVHNHSNILKLRKGKIHSLGWNLSIIIRQEIKD